MYLLQRFLSLRTLNVQYLQETISFKLKIGEKTCNFLSVYRSPRQSQDDFETFTENLELNLENLMPRNPFLVVPIADCNAKSRNLSCYGKETNSKFNIPIQNLTSKFIVPGG